MSDNEILNDLMVDDEVSGATESNQITFLAWIRVAKGTQTKNPDLSAIAKVCGETSQRALANGNTKVFNDIGRKTTLSIFRHLAKCDDAERKLVVKTIVNPMDIENLEALLKVAKAKAKAVPKP